MARGRSGGGGGAEDRRKVYTNSARALPSACLCERISGNADRERERDSRTRRGKSSCSRSLSGDVLGTSRTRRSESEKRECWFVSKGDGSPCVHRLDPDGKPTGAACTTVEAPGDWGFQNPHTRSPRHNRTRLYNRTREPRPHREEHRLFSPAHVRAPCGGHDEDIRTHP